MTYKTVLIDDEPLALKRLERLLRPYDNTIEVVGRAENGADAVALINKLKPDLVFLDIQMPELTGFDVLERLEYTPLVIFSTAYDQYALQAFDVNSIDYLLKPVDPERLKKAVNKLLRLSDAAAGDQVGRQGQADCRVRNSLFSRQRQICGSPRAWKDAPHHEIAHTARIRTRNRRVCQSPSLGHHQRQLCR
jgi:DNA-binding LytR/AlgR family response regulator